MARNGLPRHGLPKSRRLLRRSQFDRVFKQRRVFGDRCFAVYGALNDLDGPRLGMVVSRRVSVRAVDRNRIRRAIREAFRHNQDRLDAIDIVVVAKAPAATATGQELNDALIGLWTRLLEKCRKP